MKPWYKFWTVGLVAGFTVCLVGLDLSAMAENTDYPQNSCYVHPSVPPIRGSYPYSYYGRDHQKKGYTYEDWEKIYKIYQEETGRYMKIAEEYEREVNAYIEKIRAYGLKVPCDVDAAAQIRNPKRFTDIPEDSDGFVAAWFNSFPKRKEEPKLARHLLTADDFAPAISQPESYTVEAGVPGIQGYYPYQGNYQSQWSQKGYTRADWVKDQKAYQAEIERYKHLNKTYNRLTRDYLRKVRMYQGQVPCEVEEKIGVKPTPGKTYWAVPEDSDGYISEQFNGFPKPVEE